MRGADWVRRGVAGGWGGGSGCAGLGRMSLGFAFFWVGQGGLGGAGRARALLAVHACTHASSDRLVC